MQRALLLLKKKCSSCIKTPYPLRIWGKIMQSKTNICHEECEIMYSNIIVTAFFYRYPAFV